MNDTEEIVNEWLNNHLCKGEDKDVIFKAAVLSYLDRIADALDAINKNGIYTYED